MERSDSIKELAFALSVFQGQLKPALQCKLREGEN